MSRQREIDKIAEIIRGGFLYSKLVREAKDMFEVQRIQALVYDEAENYLDNGIGTKDRFELDFEDEFGQFPFIKPINYKEKK